MRQIIKINILTQGFVTPNSQAFLFPIFYFRRELKKKNFDFQIFLKFEPCIFDCDKIFIDSKFFQFDWNDKNKFLRNAKATRDYKKKVKSVFYFDTTDSSGCIQNEVFDYVDLYFKSQILKNKDLYKKKFYGSRIYSDYFYKNLKLKITS